MLQSTFNELLAELKIDTGNDLETIGLSAERGIYNLNIFGTREEEYKLNIVEFGIYEDKTWTDLEPTIEQKLALKNKLQLAQIAIEAENEEEALKEGRAKQNARDLEKYGQEGAIYSKDY